MFERCDNCDVDSCFVDSGSNCYRECHIHELDIEDKTDEKSERYEGVSSALYSSSGYFLTSTKVFNTYDDAMNWLYKDHWDDCCENRDLKKIARTKNDEINYKKMFERCDNCCVDSYRIDYGDSYREGHIRKLNLK